MGVGDKRCVVKMGYHITSIKLVQMLYSAFPTFQSQPEPRGNINSTIDSDQGKTSCYNRQNIGR